MSWLATKSSLDAVSTKSVLSPALWLVGILTVVLIPSTPLLPFWAAVAGWSLLGLVVLGTSGAFLFFCFTNPTLLRSEEYSLRERALSIYGDGKTPATQLAHIIGAPSTSPARIASRKGGPDAQ